MPSATHAVSNTYTKQAVPCHARPAHSLTSTSPLLSHSHLAPPSKQRDKHPAMPKPVIQRLNQATQPSPSSIQQRIKQNEQTGQTAPNRTVPHQEAKPINPRRARPFPVSALRHFASFPLLFSCYLPLPARSFETRFLCRAMLEGVLSCVGALCGLCARGVCWAR